MPSVSVYHVLPYPWEFVASIFWLRFPNPYAKYILSEDVLERKWISSHILFTKRLIVKDIFKVFPSWIRGRIPNKPEVVIEESIINIKDNRINTTTRNIGSLSKFGVITEKCKYEILQVNGVQHTSIHRVGDIQSNIIGIFRRPLVRFLESRCLKSARRSNLGLTYICSQYIGDKNSMLQRVRNRIQDAAIRARPQIVCASSKN